MAKAGLTLFFWGGVGMILIIQPSWNPFISIILMGVFGLFGLAALASTAYCSNCGKTNYSVLTKEYSGESRTSVNDYLDNIQSDFKVTVKCNHCGHTWKRTESKVIGYHSHGKAGSKTVYYDKNDEY